MSQIPLVSTQVQPGLTVTDYCDMISGSLWDGLQVIVSIWDKAQHYQNLRLWSSVIRVDFPLSVEKELLPQSEEFS